jgi:PmbA protein
MTDYLSLAQDVVRRVTEGRSVEAEAYIQADQETEIRVSSGNVEKLTQAGSLGLGVRVIDGGKVGYAYTSDLSEAGIESTWRAAVDLASIATPDPNRALPEPQTIPEEDLRIYDPEVERVPVSEKVELSKRLERAALDYDPRITVTQFCSYTDTVTHVYLANSRGFAGSYDRTTLAAFLYAVARGENGMTSGTGIGVANRFAELDVESIGAEAARSALAILDGKSVETQQTTVVFHPLIAAEILTYLSMALSAQSIQRGRSFLVGKQGQEIGSDKVTLLDNGKLVGGLASAPFDGEGVPTRATKLVDEGVFQRMIYDSYTARRDGVDSTGNAARSSHRTLPSLAPSNFYIQPGNETPEEIIAGVERGLYVTNIMQTGGIDPATGDCSMGANGVWIENGKLTHPVSGVTVATTLGDLLMNISAVGSDLRVVPFFGAIGAPTLRVDKVMVGGGT